MTISNSNMKKIMTMLSLALAVMAQAQILQVNSVELIDVTASDDMVMQAVAISPHGDYLMLSTDTKKGLIKWDLNTGNATTITTDEGAGSDVRISDDGRHVVYSEVTYKDRRRHQAIKAMDLSTAKKQTLVKPTRDLRGFALDHGTAMTLSGEKVKLHGLGGTKGSITRPQLTAYHLKLYITTSNGTSLLAPNGTNENYVWGSLSPDGSRVLYYVSGRGTFVCNIDGSGVIAMGDLTAPKWWDNNTIVGMNETDDEYTITSSTIVARNLDGTEQVLTGDDVIATYPLPSQQSGKIAFSTPDGQIYVITLE